MKIRLIVAILGLAISFAVPAFAQQKDTAASQIDGQVTKKIDEGFNNGDAAAVGALFTEDAVLVNDTGPVYGRKAIEKSFADLFQKWRVSNHISKRDQYSPHIIGTAGNEAWSNGEWSQTYQVNGGRPIQFKGYWSNIQVREGDAWKTRMTMSNVTP